MQYLIAFIITFIFSYLSAGAIRKKPLPFYITGALISTAAATASLMHTGSEAVRKYLIDPFSGGAFAGAFWSVIMLIGALPAGGRLIKRLMPARGELSVLAAAITLSHIVTYGVTYIKRLISPDLRATGDFVITCIVCLLLVLIMLPLTVISFKRIRARFKGRTWKRLQRTAYVFYALIYVHVMVIFIPRARLGQEGYYLSCIAYTAVWSAYFALRLRKAYLKNKKPVRQAALNAGCTATAMLCIGAAAFFSLGSPKAELQTAESVVPSTKVAPVVFTAASVQSQASEVTVALQTEVTRTTGQNVASASTAEQVSEDVTTTGSRAKRKRATTISKTASRSDESNKESEAETASADAAAETAAPSGVEKTETEAASSTAQRETKAATTARSAPAQTERSAAKTPARTAAATTAKPAETAASNTTASAAAAPPEYKYNNGTYTDKAYGYDGYIHVTLTIENDIITSFSAYTEEESEEDQAYFNMAYGPVGQAIVSSSSSDVDGVSGATISSDAIKMAAKKCLKQALK